MSNTHNTVVQNYPVTIFPDTTQEDKDAVPPSVDGEQSVSGDTPDPESDDDVLSNAQQVGLHVDEDEESPEELNIAEEVEEAEKDRRGI
jgi:hypothetical protein